MKAGVQHTFPFLFNLGLWSTGCAAHIQGHPSLLSSAFLEIPPTHSGEVQG